MMTKSKLSLAVAVLALGSIVYAQTTPVVLSQQTNAATSGAVQPQKYDPLLDLPPLPANEVSLLGGTVTRLDRVRDHIGIRAFGGDEKTVTFDVRTKFYRGSTPVADRDLKAGQRIYVDTMLNGTQVFAKNIWIEEAPSAGNGAGQVVSYDQKKGILKLRDQLTAEPVQFHLDPKTVIKEGSAVRETNVLVPGSLVSLTFTPGQQAHTTVDTVQVLARPGYTISFFGPITFLDLSRNVLAVQNRPDGKTYEINIDGIARDTIVKLHPGTVIGIAAVFDGKQYMARTLGFAPVSSTQQ